MGKKTWQNIQALLANYKSIVKTTASFIERRSKMINLLESEEKKIQAREKITVLETSLGELKNYAKNFGLSTLLSASEMEVNLPGGRILEGRRQGDFFDEKLITFLLRTEVFKLKTEEFKLKTPKELIEALKVEIKKFFQNHEENSDFELRRISVSASLTAALCARSISKMRKEESIELQTKMTTCAYIQMDALELWAIGDKLKDSDNKPEELEVKLEGSDDKPEESDVKLEVSDDKSGLKIEQLFDQDIEQVLRSFLKLELLRPPSPKRAEPVASSSSSVSRSASSSAPPSLKRTDSRFFKHQRGAATVIDKVEQPDLGSSDSQDDKSPGR